MTHEQAIQTLAAERYLLQEMSELERYQFEAHYFDCEECADEVRLGALVRDEVRTRGAVAERTAVSPPVSRRHLFGIGHVVPWAVAASLALALGYQSLVTVPELRALLAPQALAPVVLRGASRGVEPVVAVEGARAFVTVAADIVADSSLARVQYELLSPERSAVISGQTPVPPPGAPLMLLIPADRFVGPGRYLLVLRDAERPDTVIGEYGFVARY